MVQQALIFAAQQKHLSHSNYGVGADGIAVGLGQVRQNQLRHGQCIAVVRRQFIAHIRKPPHFKSVLIIPFVSLFVQKTAQKSPLDFG